MVLLPCQILSDSNCAIYESASFNQAVLQRKKLITVAFDFVVEMQRGLGFFNKWHLVNLNY